MTQQKIADTLTKELVRKVHQGQVSNMLAQVRKYLKDGNVLPDLPTKAKREQGIDTSVIDIGQRTDTKTLRHRSCAQYK